MEATRIVTIFLEHIFGEVAKGLTVVDPHLRILLWAKIRKQFFFFLSSTSSSSSSRSRERKNRRERIRTSRVARLARDESGRVCGTSPGNTLSCETDNFPAPPLSFTNESSIEFPVLLRNTLLEKQKHE